MKWRRLALAAHVTATHVGHYTLWHSAGRGARLKGVWCNQIGSHWSAAWATLTHMKTWHTDKNKADCHISRKLKSTLHWGDEQNEVWCKLQWQVHLTTGIANKNIYSIHFPKKKKHKNKRLVNIKAIFFKLTLLGNRGRGQFHTHCRCSSQSWCSPFHHSVCSSCRRKARGFKHFKSL